MTLVAPIPVSHYPVGFVPVGSANGTSYLNDVIDARRLSDTPNIALRIAVSLLFGALALSLACTWIIRLFRMMRVRAWLGTIGEHRPFALRETYRDDPELQSVLSVFSTGSHRP